MPKIYRLPRTTNIVQRPGQTNFKIPHYIDSCWVFKKKTLLSTVSPKNLLGLNIQIHIDSQFRLFLIFNNKWLRFAYKHRVLVILLSSFSHIQHMISNLIYMLRILWLFNILILVIIVPLPLLVDLPSIFWPLL